MALDSYWKRRRAVHIALVAVILFGVALGLCAFDANHMARPHGSDGRSVDLCTAFFVVPSGIVVCESPLLVGVVAPELRPALVHVSISLLDPPPEFIAVRSS